MRANRERRGQLTAAQHLDESSLGHEPLASQRIGIDLGSGIEELQRVQVDDVVLDPEGIRESLGLRRAAVQRCLAALEARLDAAARALALAAAARGLAALAADPSCDPLGRVHGAPCGLQVMDLHELAPSTSSTVTRCGTLASIPRISGRSVCVTV